MLVFEATVHFILEKPVDKRSTTYLPRCLVPLYWAILIGGREGKGGGEGMWITKLVDTETMTPFLGNSSWDSHFASMDLPKESRIDRVPFE